MTFFVCFDSQLKLGEIWIGRFKIGCFASDELDRTKRRKKNLRFGRHKNECNFLLAASFHYFFFQNKIHVPLVFLQRRCVRKTKTKTKQNKTKKLPNLINYFVLECVSILYYHRPIVQFVNSWHWRVCAKEIKILLNGFIKISGRLPVIK